MWPTSLVPHLMWKPRCPSGNCFFPGETWELRGLLSSWNKTYQHLRQWFWVLTQTASLHSWKDSCTVKSDGAAPFFFSVLFQPFPEISFPHTSSGIPKLLVLCFEQQSLLSFFKPFLKSNCENSHILLPLKLNFTPSSNILKQAYGHRVYSCALLNINICPVINPCEDLRKRYLS